MANLPESTLNILIGGILGILSGLINLIFNGFILWMLKRDELNIQHKLNMIEKKQELLYRHQLEMKQKAPEQINLMQNLVFFFISWILTFGISIAISIFIVRKSITETQKPRPIMENLEKEITEYIARVGFDELKQTEAGRDLLDLLDIGAQELLPDSTSMNSKKKGRISTKGKGLGESHQRILDFIQVYQRENKYPPSIREISNKTGISYTSVSNHLNQLEEKGLIERNRKISRGVRLAGNGSADILRIPILGPIAAGLPLPELDPNISYMTESRANAVDIARSMLPDNEKGDGLFALEVKGESMIDAMINDGDVIILKPVTDARDGEMVAVWLPRDNEATLKYFFKEKDRYRLQPANPTMKPIFIKKSEPLEIKGKVVLVIRKMDSQLAV